MSSSKITPGGFRLSAIATEHPGGHRFGDCLATLPLPLVVEEMRRILRADYEQRSLLPEVLEDWIGPQHPARFIRAFVETLRLEELGIKEPNPEEGGTCFGPELLLSVWLYGYWRKVRSTRRLEDACVNDLGFLWLSGRHRPDHNALWRFWQANQGALKKLFTRTVEVALHAGLVEMAAQVIDGTKIPAACSHWGRQDAAQQARVRQKLEKAIAHLEAQIAAAPPQSEARLELTAELARESALREKVQAAAAAIAAQEARSVHPQEPEARRMKTPGRNHFAYNAQITTDAAHSVITAAEVVTQENDLQQLVPMMQAAQATTRQMAPQTLADAGYSSAGQIAAAQPLGSALYVPLARKVQNAEGKPYHESAFGFDAARDVVLCPQGRELKLHHERRRSGQVLRVYRDHAACADCPVRVHCTRDRHGRSIEISPQRTAVQKHRAHMAQEESRAIAQGRGQVVERVFAQIKAHWGFARWTLKGLAGVRAQWALLATTWNLTRLFSAWQQQPELFRRFAGLQPGTAS